MNCECEKCPKYYETDINRTPASTRLQHRPREKPKLSLRQSELLPGRFDSRSIASEFRRILANLDTRLAILTSYS